MKSSRKDNLTDVAEALAALTAQPPQQQPNPPGTVIAADGTIVTLGQQSVANTSLSSAQTSTNSVEKKRGLGNGNFHLDVQCVRNLIQKT